jgi:hypothetical protein
LFNAAFRSVIGSILAAAHFLTSSTVSGSAIAPMMIPVNSKDIDEKTDQTLENLRRHYGAASKAAVLRKAIALLNVAKRYEQLDGSLIIRQVGHRAHSLFRSSSTRFHQT